MNSIEKSKLFFTENLKLAAALTAAGFSILHIERILQGDRERLTFELEHEKHGIKATYFLGGFENKFDLSKRVNQIIEERGLTAEEYAVLAFDAARAGLHNGSTLMYCGRNQKPLKAIEIGGGRTLIYREGTPKEHLKKLIENA